jgi:CheY-like chemotaxis protein
LRPLEGGLALVLRERAEEAAAPEAVPAPPSDLAVELAREARTAATTILHAVEMAAEAAGGERLPWVESVAEAAGNLLRRVESVAELAPAPKAARARLVTFDPMSLLRDVMDGVMPLAEERGVVLEAAIYGELPERVQGDATAMRRVMRLALQYAVAETVGEADWALHVEGNRVRLEIGYAGVMELRLREWLMGPGASEAGLAEPEASLGLTRRIVNEEMGGRLAVLVTLDGRTRLTYEWDWTPAAMTEPEPVAAGVELAGTSILAVTPDRSLRKVLQMRFAALGVGLMTVESTAEAAQVLTEAAPGAFDLVLVQYSKKECLEFSMWLLRNERWKTLPRITVSMAGEPGQAGVAEAAGYQAYLTPPLPLEMMRDALTALLVRAAAGAEGELITRFSLAEAAQARAGAPEPMEGRQE